jgi:hypothetical protein
MVSRGLDDIGQQPSCLSRAVIMGGKVCLCVLFWMLLFQGEAMTDTWNRLLKYVTYTILSIL